jgi:hypothetical protein
MLVYLHNTSRYWVPNLMSYVRRRGDRPPLKEKCIVVYLANVERQGILVSYQWKFLNGSRHLELFFSRFF